MRSAKRQRTECPIKPKNGKTTRIVSIKTPWYNEQAWVLMGWYGDLYLVESHTRNVHVYNVKGDLLARWRMSWVDEQSCGIVNVGAVAVGVEGGWSLLRSPDIQRDGMHPPIAQLDRFLFQIPQLAMWPPGLRPIVMRYAVEDRICAIDAYTRHICVYRPNGERIAAWRMPSVLYQIIPSSVGYMTCTLDHNGRLLLAETRTQFLYCFDVDRGACLYQWQLQNKEAPRAIAVDGRGQLYVTAGRNTHRFDSTLYLKGTWAATTGTDRCGAIVGLDGRVYRATGKTGLIDLLSVDGSKTERRVHYHTGYTSHNCNFCVGYTGILYMFDSLKSALVFAPPMYK